MINANNTPSSISRFELLLFSVDCDFIPRAVEAGVDAGRLHVKLLSQQDFF